MNLSLTLQISLKHVNFSKLTAALTYTLPPKLESQTDVTNYLMHSISMITSSDLNASHTWILTAMF